MKQFALSNQDVELHISIVIKVLSNAIDTKFRLQVFFTIQLPLATDIRQTLAVLDGCAQTTCIYKFKIIAFHFFIKKIRPSANPRKNPLKQH